MIVHTDVLLLMSSVGKPSRCVGDGSGVGAALGLAEGSVEGAVVSLAAGGAAGLVAEGAVASEADGDPLTAVELGAGALAAGEPEAEVLAVGPSVGPDGVVPAGDAEAAGLALGAVEGAMVTSGVGVGVGVGSGMKLGSDGRGFGSGSIGPGVSWLSQVYPACVAEPK